MNPIESTCIASASQTRFCLIGIPLAAIPPSSFEAEVVMARRRHELSDEEWALLEPLLPQLQTPGRHYRDHRTVLNGMLFRLNTGIPWRDLPERYGPWQTVYSRSRRWARTGVWDRMLQTLQTQLDAAGSIDWSLWCVDGSNVRAHQAAAGAGKKTAATRARRSRSGT